MRIASKGYKEWKKRKNEIDLKKRTEKRLAKKTRNRIKNDGNNNYKKQNIFTEVIKKFPSPTKLSLIKNPDETIRYFNQVITFIKSNKKTNYNSLLIDVEMVQYLSIDSLMYLLAIINNIKIKKSHIHLLRGNLPKNSESKKKFMESGFLNFVTTGIDLSNIKTDSNLRIANGTKVDTDIAASLVDFVNNYFKNTKSDSKFLYHMIIELMTNTNNHAYIENYPLMNSWYLSAEKDEKENKILVTFLDTGEGIPKTIAKKFLENIISKTDTEYIKSALDGEFRTQTKEENRGKGLPDIYDHYKNKKIKNFKIISCNGNFTENDKEMYGDLKENLKGTVFYWEIDSSSFIEGEKNDN